MNIIPKLNLNKHPKDCQVNTLVNAVNVKLSSDGSCLQSEESIIENEVINNYINELNLNNAIIIACIPINTELIILVTDENVTTYKDGIPTYVIRYNEHLNECKTVTNKLLTHGGDIKGTFTYNVKGELILSIAEKSEYCDVPLKTINCGLYEDNIVELDDNKLSNAPEVLIPSLENLNYVTASTPKGQYHLFIQYKIDAHNYTQWFELGYPILINSIDKQSIINYPVFGSTGNLIQINEVHDYFSNEFELSTDSINFDLVNLDNRYSNYRLAFICVRNDNAICKHTFDININVTNFTIDSVNFVNETTIEDIVTNNYNYYNVGNIINYKNRLYISNYKENKSVDNSFVSQHCKLTLGSERIFIHKFNNTSEHEVQADWNYELEIYEDDNKKIINPFEYPEELRSYIERNNFQLKYKNYDCKIRFYNGDNEVYINGKLKLYTNKVNRKINLHLICTIPFSTNYTDYCTLFAHTYYDIENYSTGDPSKDEMLNYLSNCLDVINRVITHDNIDFKKLEYHNRLLNTTLIPGELYNFYVHFINKYGEVTEGIKINSNMLYNTVYINKILDSEVETVFENTYLIPATPRSMFGTDARAAVRLTDKVFNDDGTINYLCIGILTYLGKTSATIHYVTNPQPFIDTLNTLFGDIKYSNLTWEEVINNKLNDNFIPYVNSNGDTLYKVPLRNDINYNAYSYNIYYPIIQFDELPEDYIGYFLSYEKFEKRIKTTGILTKCDFTNVEGDENKLMFYSSDYDLLDNVDISYNKLYIDSSCDIENKNNTTDENNNVLNREIENAYYKSIYCDIKNYNINIGGDTNRRNLGTGLELDTINELFVDGESKYIASIVNLSNQIYINTNKTLIKCSNVFYDTDEHEIKNGLNGRLTFNSFLIYNNKGVMLDVSTTKVNTSEFKEGFTEYKENDYPVVYLNIPCYNDFMYECKEFNNPPQSKGFFKGEASTVENEITQFVLGNIVLPKDSIDLFKIKTLSQDYSNPKTYINFNRNNPNIEEFNKTVRRSDIIQDESLVNAWRKFPVEGYKIISENKGNITNIVAFNNYLLVHCEHSLFMFNNDNTLRTQDKEIELAYIDIFETEYREVLTSDLGKAGLQDDRAWICDEFGYIFYDNDDRRLYRFSNKSLDYIDYDIVNYLKKYDIKKVRFGHDEISNRVIMTYNIDNIQHTLSYNYGTNSFISTHEYSFKFAYNTKNKLYLSTDNQIFIFDYSHNVNNGYNKFDISENINNRKSRVDIIVNAEYELMKALEFIVYKLYKIDITHEKDYILNDIESHKEPYSGETIRVFNNLIDTGILDIKIDAEESKNEIRNWNKPHWDLTNWNFNYLRNNNTQFVADRNSRLYGNYFIISIVFGGDKNKCELETLTYQLIRK